MIFSTPSGPTMVILGFNMYGLPLTGLESRFSYIFISSNSPFIHYISIKILGKRSIIL